MRDRDKLIDYIVILKGHVSDAVCDLIVDTYETSQHWLPSTIGGTNMDRKIRNCDSIAISKLQKNEDKEIDKKLFRLIGSASLEYAKRFKHYSYNEDTGYDLLRYLQGGYYKEHVDSFTAHLRSVSCSLALNYDYEGGEWSFFDDSYSFRVNKGDIVMFPSNFMFPHQIKEVTFGTRYSVITWFN